MTAVLRALLLLLIPTPAFAADIRLGQRIDGPMCRLDAARLVLSVNQAEFLCLNREGEQIWKYLGVSGRVPTGRANAIASPRNRCVIVIGNGIAALDFDGKELWRNSISRPTGEKSVLSSDQSLLFALEPNQTLSAYDVRTGAHLWTGEEPVDSFVPLSIGADSIAGVDVLGRIVCFNTDGSHAWTAKFESRIVGLADANKAGDRAVLLETGATALIHAMGSKTALPHAPITNPKGVRLIQEDQFLCFSSSHARLFTRRNVVWEASLGIKAVERLYAIGGVFVASSESEEWSAISQNGNPLKLERDLPGAVSTNFISIVPGEVSFGTDTGWFCTRRLR